MVVFGGRESKMALIDLNECLYCIIHKWGIIIALEAVGAVSLTCAFQNDKQVQHEFEDSCSTKKAHL